MRCKCLTWHTEKRAEIKTLLPSSLMVKISLTDSSQITPLSLVLYVTHCQKKKCTCKHSAPWRVSCSNSIEEENHLVMGSFDMRHTIYVHSHQFRARVANTQPNIQSVQQPPAKIRSDCRSQQGVCCCAPLTCQTTAYIHAEKTKKKTLSSNQMDGQAAPGDQDSLIR